MEERGEEEGDEVEGERVFMKERCQRCGWKCWWENGEEREVKWNVMERSEKVGL